tara:strand:+ start:2813 stop:3109 length:297 start_codon:yes stop_codon:yes gene_type:complete
MKSINLKRKKTINKDKQIENLNNTIEALGKQKFFQMYNSLWKMILVYLLKGLASGLGWVIGATILVSILTYMLSQIEFIPILGDIVSRVIEEIEKFDR